MIRINKALFVSAIVFVLVVTGCSQGPKMVPAPEFKSIITETLITDAALDNQGRLLTSSTFADTVDYYAPIVSKYGYTAADMRYTLAVMVSRKSNPLNNILNDVVKEIEAVSKAAEFRYREYQRFDSMALVYYRDTVHTRPGTVTGSLSKVKINILKPKLGNYTVSFGYRSVDDYRGRSKKVSYHQNGKADILPIYGAFFLSRNKVETPFSSAIEVVYENVDTLVIEFAEGKIDSFNAMVPDTSYVKDIVVVYTPSAKKARSDFYIEKTGFSEPLFEKYEKRFFTPKDSIPFPIVRIGRDSTAVGS